ncbi:MAG: hypothetical protein AAB573_02485 [Patescibacteria group bacterium]
MAGETPLGPHEGGAHTSGEDGDAYTEDGERVVVPFTEHHG